MYDQFHAACIFAYHLSLHAINDATSVLLLIFYSNSLSKSGTFCGSKEKWCVWCIHDMWTVLCGWIYRIILKVLITVFITILQQHVTQQDYYLIFSHKNINFTEKLLNLKSFSESSYTLQTFVQAIRIHLIPPHECFLQLEFPHLALLKMIPILFSCFVCWFI